MQAWGQMTHVLFRPPANRVPRLLSDLLSWWNGKFHEFKNGSEQEKVHAIAEFHHSLLSIHPLLDGNGRLARTLLQMQIEELFEKTANINPRPKNYYDALHKADWGDMNQLESIIRKCVSAS